MEPSACFNCGLSTITGPSTRIAGIVTCRQRPLTASGVTFVTLEDETGTINVVIWRTTAEKYRRELFGSAPPVS